VQECLLQDATTSRDRRALLAGACDISLRTAWSAERPTRASNRSSKKISLKRLKKLNLFAPHVSRNRWTGEEAVTSDATLPEIVLAAFQHKVRVVFSAVVVRKIDQRIVPKSRIFEAIDDFANSGIKRSDHAGEYSLPVRHLHIVVVERNVFLWSFILFKNIFLLRNYLKNLKILLCDKNHKMNSKLKIWQTENGNK
jgi:hypothetical protein